MIYNKIKNNRYIIENEKIYWSMYLIVFGLGLYTLMSTNITYIESTDIGLLTKLKISFWLGLFLACILLYDNIRSNIKSNYKIVGTLFLIIFYLYYIPILVHENQSITWASYYPSSESKVVISTGYISEKESSAGLMNYNSWPAFSSISAILQLLSNISIDNLIKYFPIFIMTLYIIFIYLILKIMTDDIFTSFLGAVWFLASFFINIYYFGPQSFAYIIYLASFMLLLKLFYIDNMVYIHGNMFVLKMTLVILFISMLFFHGLAPILTLVILTSLYLCQINGLYKDKKFIGKDMFRNLITLFIVLIFIYNIYLAYRFLDITIEKIYDVALGSEEIPIYKEGERIEGMLSQRILYFSQIGIALLNMIIFVVYILFKIVKKKTMFRTDIFATLSLLLLGIFSLSAVYGHEAPMRGFMFGLPLLSYFAITSLKNNKKLITLVMILLVFLHMPADYADNSFRTVTTTELKGTKFFSDRSNAESCSYSFPWYIRYFSPDTTTKFIKIMDQPFTSIPDFRKLTDTYCILYSALQINYYSFYIGYDPIDKLFLDENFESIYNNGRFVYFRK